MRCIALHSVLFLVSSGVPQTPAQKRSGQSPLFSIGTHYFPATWYVGNNGNHCRNMHEIVEQMSLFAAEVDSLGCSVILSRLSRNRLLHGIT